jgi:hypothetical protein
MGRRYLIIIGALALLVGVIVFFQKRGPEELSREELPLVVEEPPAQLEPPPGPPPIVSPVPREPVPPPPLVTEPEPPPEPLPALDESDPALVESLAGVTDQEWISQSLVAQDVARKIVVTVDNLPRQKVAQQLRPIRPVPGRFLVDGPEDARVISPDNYSRYSAFVKIVDATDANQIAAMYQRYYPLFQQAYRELGYPTQSFNARVIEVIDDLLAAPAPAQPIRLERPHVLYTYADEDLEAASAGQKVLMRMGPSNAAVVKAKLREIRAAIIE